MDPVTLVIIPGFLGGLVVALFMTRLHGAAPGVDPLRRHPLTTDVINMARIRVSGIGGFGLMAMALAVAWFVPRIRQHLVVSALLGIAFAVVLIALRRRSGPMASSSGTPGANTVLSIDSPLGLADDGRPTRPVKRVLPATP